MADTGRILASLGTVFLLLALVFNIVPNLPKLPGDIYFNKGPIRFYIPFTSALISSVILTLIFNYFKN